MSINLEKTKQAGLNLTEVVFIPHTEKEYKKLLKMLENLIDEVGENEDHPLASLMEIIGILMFYCLIIIETIAEVKYNLLIQYFLKYYQFLLD